MQLAESNYSELEKRKKDFFNKNFVGSVELRGTLNDEEEDDNDPIPQFVPFPLISYIAW